MDTEIQNQEPNQITPENQEIKKTHDYMRIVLIVLIAIGLGVISFMAYKNPALFTASLTGGSNRVVTTNLYIPSDYSASAGEQGVVHLLAGQLMGDMTAIDMTLSFDSNKVTLVGIEGGSDLPTSFSWTNPPLSDNNKFRFTLASSAPADFSVNDELLKIHVSLASGLASGDKVSFVQDSLTITAADPAIPIATYSPGEITIGTSTVDKCKSITVPTYSTCDPVTGKWTCNKGYDPTYNCTACITGYSGYPSCALSLLADIEGVILTLDDETIEKLSNEERKKAYKSAYLMLNSSQSAGALIGVETSSITVLACADPAAVTEKDLVECMVNDVDGNGSADDGLAAKLEAVVGVNVTTYPSVPGLLKLTSGVGNADNSLDGMLTSSGEVLILPGMDYAIQLSPISSYQTRVVGKNGSETNVTYQDLKYDDITWMPQPTDRLDSEALNGGLLEMGTKTGQTPLYIALSMDDGSTLNSINKLTIDVPSAPIIEYLRRIGTNPIEKGGRVNLSVKIYDAETINDIKDIRSSIVRTSVSTTGITYNDIKNDAGAVWFTATPYLSDVSVTDSGTQTSTNTTSVPGGSTTTTTSTSTTLNYKIYSIPIDIPQDANLTDGTYMLVLEITDTASRVAAGLMSMPIGSVATGDVDGSGTVTMLDVIKAFQIANGATGTQSELQAADLNNDGKVTMLDVITLFNQIK